MVKDNLKLTSVGKGFTLEEAIDNLTSKMEHHAKEHGLIVPQDKLSVVSRYQVGVRRQNGGRYHVAAAAQTYQEAFESALALANFKNGYDPKKHRVIVQAEYDAKPLKGTPSGADRYSRVPEDLTNDLF
ncbi:hypothetical protein HYU21_04770 [Candidatus Woesearchaeota archaeon]|nr:hypothetical protein [Candidatus Woesearchaeota archaeon]